jgi:hypothetical protein
MPIVELKKSGINLWEEYPDLEFITEFKELKDKEGAEKSNNILKAIYYIWDPKSDKRDSGFTEEELIKDINKNLIGEKNFKWSNYEKTKAAWDKYCLTKTDTILVEYETKISQVNEVIKTMPVTKENIKEIGDYLKLQKSLLLDYAEVKKEFVQEQISRAEMENGYVPSLNEEEAFNV